MVVITCRDNFNWGIKHLSSNLKIHKKFQHLTAHYWNQEVDIIFKIDPGLRPKIIENRKKIWPENFPHAVNFKIKIQEMGNLIMSYDSIIALYGNPWQRVGLLKFNLRSLNRITFKSCKGVHGKNRRKPAFKGGGVSAHR